MRTFSGQKLIIATHNEGKLREFKTLLAPFVAEIVSSGQLGLNDPEETGKTFVENAILKAVAAAKATQQIALADDSGLCVHALENAPGIYTARWGVGKNMLPGMERIHRELGNNIDRSAHFTCALALAWPDGHVESVEGRVDGTIVWPPQGEGGHGYDPVFVPEGKTKRFSEMPEEEKGLISHRGRALRALVQKYFSVDS